MVKGRALRNEDEEAREWEARDLSGELEQMPPARLRAKRPLTHVLSIRMSSEDIAKLQALANSRGVGLTTLARMLVKGVLEEDAGRSASLAVREKGEAGYSSGFGPPRYLVTEGQLEGLVAGLEAGVQRLIGKRLERYNRY